MLLGATTDPAVDAGADAGDGAAAIDGAGGGDGSAKDGTTGDAGPCTAKFCSDFDPPYQGWPFEWNDAGPPLFKVTATDSTSPPNALDMLVDTDNFVASLETTGDFKFPFVLTMDLKLLDVAQSASLDFHLVEVTLPVCTDGVKLKIDQNSGGLKVQSSNNDPGVYGTIPKGEWVSLELRIEAKLATLKNLKTQAIVSSVGTNACTSASKVRLGALMASGLGGTSWHLLVDHVRVN